MGNKAGAKEIMQKAGVPVVPGYQGADQSDAVMLAEAKKIGFPVMIKAVAGGGGRGMRLVADEAGFPEALRSARSEAKAAFGDGAVILERAIKNPRHIEIQVFGDRYGNAIHLGERDCSVQRRHQKLIEEAPSPAVSQKLRQRMGEVAVAAVRSLRYEGAGTLEFLLDEQGEFYFMEMNTRLQVEHPVTEAITGLDLVELQLRVAGGEPLGLVQEEIKFSGHAIEVRLCSEDAEHDFMPQSGTMARWRMPEGVRVEHALQSGSEIPPFYDSMIAKLIASGSSREEARSRLICGLEQTIAFGVTTNQSFLMACLRHPAFAKGEATTGFIGSHRGELVTGAHREEAPVEGVASEVALAALLLHVTHPQARSRRSGRTLAATFPIPLRVEIDRSVHDLELLREREGGYRVNDGGRDYRFEIEEIDAEAVRFRNGVVIERAEYWRDGDRLWFLHRGEHPFGSRSHAGRARDRCGEWRRRQDPRRDERPRRRGAGEKGRSRHRRSGGDDAGSHEDGACASRRHRRHGQRDRCRRGRAGRDGEGRGGDRGGLKSLSSRSERSEATGTHSHRPLFCEDRQPVRSSDRFRGMGPGSLRRDEQVATPSRPVPSFSRHAT